MNFVKHNKNGQNTQNMKDKTSEELEGSKSFLQVHVLTELKEDFTN